MDQAASQARACTTKAELDINNDGITDISDDACGDIPYITMVKKSGNNYSQRQRQLHCYLQHHRENTGGAAGTYSLKDSPLFDDDITIVGGTFSGQARGDELHRKYYTGKQYEYKRRCHS